MLLLTDNPVGGASDDKFGFRDHARILYRAISATNDLPLTVGVYGPWGSGKSSFLNLCQEIFDRAGVPTIRFNPWKYDQRDEVWHALIQTILSQMSAGLARSAEGADPDRKAHIGRILTKVKALSMAAAWLVTRHAIGLASAGVITAEDADKLLSAWVDRGAEAYKHVNEFEDDFREAVDTYTDGRRLIIFIDDLDRCMPDSAVTVLDSLRLFLGEASCVFVLAMDHHMIAEAVAARIGGDTDRGRQYLEKLIQFPFHLPAVKPQSLYRTLHQNVVGLRDDPALWKLIEHAFGGNPRRVRRFINALNFSIETLRGHSEPPRDRQLQMAILLAFRFEYPDFFRALQANAAAWRDAQGPHERLLRVVDPKTDPRFPPAPKAEDIRLLTDVVTMTTASLEVDDDDTH